MLERSAANHALADARLALLPDRRVPRESHQEQPCLTKLTRRLAASWWMTKVKIHTGRPTACLLGDFGVILCTVGSGSQWPRFFGGNEALWFIGSVSSRASAFGCEVTRSCPPVLTVAAATRRAPACPDASSAGLGDVGRDPARFVLRDGRANKH